MSFREILIVAVVSLVIAAAVYPGAVFSSRYYANGKDLAHYAATRTLVRDAFHSFSLPLWNAYSGCGQPLAANPQFQTYYPPAVISMFLPPGIAMNWLMLLHTALAGVGMWLLLRTFGLRRDSAAFGAVAFMLSGFLISHRGHVAMHATAAWAPLVVFLWFRTRDGRGIRRLLIFVIILALQILAGHLQIVFMTCALLTGREFYFFLAKQRSRLRLLAAAFAAAILLTSMQLIPAILLTLRSDRFHVRVGDFFRGAMGIKALFTFIIPYFNGGIRDGFFGATTPGRPNVAETMCYIGILPLVFSARAFARVFGKPRRIEPSFWILAVLFGLAILPGKYSPLAWLLHVLPVSGSFRVPARWLFVIHFGIAVASAFAFDSSFRARRKRSLASDVILSACAVWVIALPLFSRRLLVPRFVMPAIIMFLSVVYLVLSARMRRPHFRWAAVGLLILDMAFFAHFFDLPRPVSAAELTASGNETAKNIPGGKVVPERIFSASRPGATPDDLLSPNINAACRLSSPLWTGPYGSPDAAFLLFSHGGGGTHRFDALLANQKIISMLGAAYVILPPADAGNNMARFEGFTPPLDIPLVHDRSETSETRGVAESGSTVSYLARRAVTHWQVFLSPGRLYELSFDARFIEEEGGYFRCSIAHQNHNFPGEAWRICPEFLTGEFRSMRHTFHVRRDAPNPLTLEIRSEGETAIELRNIRLREFPTGHGGGYDIHRSLPGGVGIFSNTHSLRRAFCVPQVKCLPDELLIREAMWNADFDPSDTAFVENRPELAGQYGKGNAEIEAWSPDKMTISVSGDERMFLIVSESFWGGWRCSIDGDDVPIHRVNLMLRGIIVPPGKHEVVFTYNPLECYLGWGISLFALFLFLAGVFLYGRWKKSWPHLFNA
ncbi:MAG: hypothetical protein ACYS8W_06635 [Planctomycetota bacterium]|jgi:hypothetical protein